MKYQKIVFLSTDKRSHQNGGVIFLSLLICCLSFCLKGYSQVVIIPRAVPTPFFKLDQLLKVQLVNTSTQPVTGVLQLSLEDRSAQNILQLQSLPLSLKGNQSYSAEQLKWEKGIDLSNQSAAQILSRSGQLIGGQYVYCYRFVELKTNRSLGNYCQESSWQNTQAPRLAYPYDKQEILNRFPVLNWHPPLPIFGRELNYSLRLVEIENGQSPTEALYQNVPLLERYNLKSQLLHYPLAAMPLKENRQYAWQVAALWNNIPIGKTEIWEFSIEKSKQPPIVTPLSPSFRFVKRKLDGTNYLFTDKLLFAYDNRSYEKQLHYQIYAKNKEEEVQKNLPIISLQPGLNSISLDFKKQLKLEKEQAYILKIIDAQKTAWYLEFVIEN